MGRLVARSLGLSINMQLFLVYLSVFPEVINNELLRVILILDLIAVISVHYLITYFLATVDLSIITTIWNLVSGTPLEKLFIVGVIIHVYLIQNSLIINII